MLAITLPSWLVDFWSVYGEIIMPIIMTVLSAVVTWMALKIKTDAKLRLAQAEAQLNALNSLAENTNTTEESKEQNTKLELLQNSVNYLADMLFIAFKNTNLDPDIKANLESITNKIKYGTTDDLVTELQNEKTKLEEQLAALATQATTTVVETVATEVNKRIRR